MLEGSREWCLGRRGELLTTALWAEAGFLIHDLSSMGHAGAPQLQKATERLTAPDALMIRNLTFYVDTKTKDGPLEWGGGPRDFQGRRMPAGKAHGINRNAYAGYWRTQRSTGLPVIIVVVDISSAVMLANSLKQLGEPYPSINAEHDMVNWPASKFVPVQDFSAKHLPRYFYEDPNNPNRKARTPRPPPAGVPSPEAMRRWLDLLAPDQGQFPYLRELILRELEQRWDEDA